MRLPQVAIVGRPNVGKSSLFNKLAGKRIAIVDPTPGVTRDRISAQAQWQDTRFQILDTGGIGVVDELSLAEQIEAQIAVALNHADYILFLVDAKEGITGLDINVAEILRKTKKPCLLAANKAEGKMAALSAAEFYRLGMGEPFLISAKTGTGLDELLDALISKLPQIANDAAWQTAGARPLIALAGRRNAGKSTLVNALAGETRVLVSEIPGTTRDAIDVQIETADLGSFTLIDTAGLRKKKSLQSSIEFFSLARAEMAIRRADVVLLMFDCTTEISEVDKKLARFVRDHYKPCIIVGAKWDLSQAATETFTTYIRGKLPLLQFAPIAFLSALKNVNLWETMRLAFELFKQAGTQVATSQLNKALDAAREIKLPSGGGGTVKIFYGTQIDVHPPTILLFVNETKHFGKEYDRFLQNQLRAALPFPEVPIRIVYRKREKLQLDKKS